MRMGTGKLYLQGGPPTHACSPYTSKQDRLVTTHDPRVREGHVFILHPCLQVPGFA